jgi:hypothetical protein
MAIIFYAINRVCRNSTVFIVAPTRTYHRVSWHKVTGLNLGRHTNYPELTVCSFLHSLQENADTTTSFQFIKLSYHSMLWRSHDCSVGIATGYRLGGTNSIPGTAKFLCSPQCPDRLWGPPRGTGACLHPVPRPSLLHMSSWPGAEVINNSTLFDALRR